jgi:alpha-L-arabinofuranosidase
MKIQIRATGGSLGRAGAQLLSNNIEAYENTIPCMLSDRLRNPKFAGPENAQTGLAAEWEPAGNGMPGFSCRLVPGMYLSGREAQLIHNYTGNSGAGILQAGVPVRAGEEFEVELWARAQHRPVTVSVELRLPGQATLEASKAEMTVALAHWHRRTCRLTSPGAGGAYFQLNVPADSRIVIDQIHLRPVGQTHVSQELLDAFDQFPCPVLRFPGGCVTCSYHWEHGIGPVHRRPVCDDPVFKYKLHYDFGTDDYLALCVAKGIRPFITLNTTTATPEDAAAWAAYVRNWYVSRGLAIPAAYFMFGNENYGTWEIGHMTGEMYAAQLREFVPPVRAAYPEARMLAIGEFESFGLRDEFKTPWRSVVIEKAADLFDTLVVTRYTGASDSLTLPESMKAVADSVADKAADLQWQAHSIREAGLDCTMGIVEWNYWTRASHNDHAGFFEPNDIRHCLYAAGYLNAFCRMGEILEVANFYSLINTMGIVHVHDGRVQMADVIKVFNLYAPALPGEVLELEVAAPALTEKSPAMDANFLRTGDATYGFLVNYSATETAEVALAGLGRIRDARGLSAQGILEPVTDFVPAVAGTTVTLPPMSLARVSCGKEQ